MSRTEIYVCIIAAVVTFLIRALPFILSDIFHKGSDSRFLDRLNQLLTPALIGMLVVYCLKDVSFSDPTAIAAAIAIVICVASYIWKRNTLLSIVLPTIIYMVLIRIL